MSSSRSWSAEPSRKLRGNERSNYWARLDSRSGLSIAHPSSRAASSSALPLVLADEPTGNLDEHTADAVLAEFLSLVRGEGSAALVATHNERLAARMDRVVRLHEGRLE